MIEHVAILVVFTLSFAATTIGYFLGKSRQKDKRSLLDYETRDRIEALARKKGKTFDEDLSTRKSSLRDWVRSFWADYKNRTP